MVARLIRSFFVDPLSVKELSGIARRWQTYIGRGIYVGLIGLIIWIFWTNLARGGGWMSPSAYAELGRQLFFSFFTLQMVVVTFGGISAGSDMITREIRGGTLGLLALTPLTPWRIVAGKWKAAVIQTSTAVLCGAPVFAVCIYLGGATPWDLLYTTVLSVVSASLGAAVALLCSTFFRASYVASIVSFIVLIGYCIAPMILLGMARGEKDVLTLLIYSHLLFASIAAASPFGGMPSMLPTFYGWVGASIVSSGAILVLLRWAASRVRVLVRRPGGMSPTTDVRVASTPVGPRTSAFGRMLRGGRGVWEHNAILWKELSTRRVGAGRAARLGMYLLLFGLLTALPADGWWRVLVLWFSSFVLVLAALANGVSLFVTEREERKWDVLLTTPLRSAEIVTAKLIAGLAGLVPLALILGVFWILTGAAFHASAVSLGMTACAMGLVTVAAYVIGAFASLGAAHQRAAFSTSFGAVIAVLFVVPALAFMFEAYHVFGRGQFVEALVGSTNPGSYLVLVSEPLSRDRPWDPAYDRWTSRERELAPMFMIYASVYSAVIVGLVLWMIQRFDRAAGRS